MKGFRHSVNIKIHKNHFRDMMAWLHGQNHVLHETVKFGKNHYSNGDDFVTQQVCFKEKGPAAMFKLAWG